MASEAAEIREAIEETRAQLGETVQALAEKADVKAQVAKKVEHTKENTLARAQDMAHSAAGVPAKAASHKRVAVPMLVAGLGIGLLVLRRHRRRSRSGATEA